MDNENKTQLQEIIETTNPKSVSAVVKSKKELYTWVNKYYGKTISERIFNALRGVEIAEPCPNNKEFKFKSIVEGYGYCGRSSACECARKAVSDSVKEKKQLASEEEKAVSLARRTKTNLQRYGVANVGQTEQAKRSREQFYLDANKVKQSRLRFKQTCLTQFGVDNPGKDPVIQEQIAQTLYVRYGVKNISHIDGVVEKRNATKHIKYPSYSDHMLFSWFEKMQSKLFSDFKIELLCKPENYQGTDYKYDCRCCVCGHVFVKSLRCVDELSCKQCNPVHGSAEQTEIYTFLTSIGVSNVLVNDRTVLNGKELDFYLPDCKLAIEYNGIYWHNDSRVENNYHKEKHDLCAAAGIQLIHVYSPYWKNKRSIIESMIKHKLHLVSDRVYARKCVVKEVSSKESALFLEQHHIFGSAKSPIRYGLYYDDKLVSLMLFSCPRKGIGKNQQGLELVRYASALSVVGGASKLLNYVIKTMGVSRIYSYSDNSYSDGNLYKQLGFALENEQGPSYWYVDPNTEQIYHRYQFRKDILQKYGFNKDEWTEKDAMETLGYYRLYDAGKKTWVLECTT